MARCVWALTFQERSRHVVRSTHSTAIHDIAFGHLFISDGGLNIAPRGEGLVRPPYGLPAMRWMIKPKRKPRLQIAIRGLSLHNLLYPCIDQAFDVLVSLHARDCCHRLYDSDRLHIDHRSVGHISLRMPLEFLQSACFIVG